MCGLVHAEHGSRRLGSEPPLQDLRDTVLVVMCPDLARDGGHIGVGVPMATPNPAQCTSPSRWACHRRPIAALDHVHDGPSDRRARSKPPALTPGHSGQPGRSAQAGQIQHASHSLHRRVRWTIPCSSCRGGCPAGCFYSPGRAQWGSDQAWPRRVHVLGSGNAAPTVRSRPVPALSYQNTCATGTPKQRRGRLCARRLLHQLGRRTAGR